MKDAVYDTLRTVAKHAVPGSAVSVLEKGIVHVNRIIAEDPFAGEGPELLVHCCHHRSGTVWFTRVLSTVARRYGLHFQAGAQEALKPSTEVFL
jgi:hypothetical protein